MKKISKKIIISVFAALFLSVFSYAIEWGGVIQNDSKVGINDVTKAGEFSSWQITQSNGVYFWLNAPISPDSSWYFTSEALYKYKFDILSKNFTNIIDFDLLKITGQVHLGSGVFNAAFGRYFVVDNSTAIFAQTCDGISLKYSLPAVDFGVYAGYTGFLNSLNVTMLGKEGFAVADSGVTTNFYSLSRGYLPVIVSMELPTFLGNQTLGVQASAFFDFSSEKYSRYYLNAMMKGPISGSIFYTVSTTFGVPELDFINSLSNLTTLDFSFYAENYFAISVGVVYASGNNGFLHSFRGFTSYPAFYSKSQPELSGILMPNLKITLAGKVAGFEFDAKLVAGIPDNSFEFKGAEADGILTVNCTSDLQLGLDIKAYYDIAGKGADSYYQAAINFAFAF